MIKVLLVDDQRTTVEVLKSHLSTDSSLEVVGTAREGQEAIQKVEELSPDIVLIDIEMPGIDGLSAARTIVHRKSSPEVIMLSSHDDDKYLRQALLVGAKGYLLKATPAREIIDAIYTVSRGYYYIGPVLMERVVQGFLNGQATEAIAPEVLPQPAIANDVGYFDTAFEKLQNYLEAIAYKQESLEKLLKTRSHSDLISKTEEAIENQNQFLSREIFQYFRRVYAQLSTLNKLASRIDNLAIVLLVGLCVIGIMIGFNAFFPDLQ